MFMGILIGLIIGMLIGRFFRNPRECPLMVRGYDCKGVRCDHSDQAYYQAKLDEAKYNDRPLGRF